MRKASGIIVSSMKTIAWLGLSLALAGGLAAAANVRCELSLTGDKTRFRPGERIDLKLAFIADDSGYVVNTTQSSGPPTVDAVTLTPDKGIYPWSADLGRFVRYQNDVVTVSELVPQSPVEVPMTLNDDYRFDEPGHYRIGVTSQRVSMGRPHASFSSDEAPPLKLTCNDIYFEVLPPSPADEDSLVGALEQRIRASGDANAAQELISSQLDYLPGDRATDAKISIYLNPVVLNDLTTNASRGLWIARDRQKIVAALEKAIVNPIQRSPINMDLLHTVVFLKASLDVPYAQSHGRMPQRVIQLSAGYIHQIAMSIPKRSGEPGIEAAQAVFEWLAANEKTSDLDFDLAREYLVAHFQDVDPYSIQGILQVYGRYLRDRRMIPALQRIIEATTNPAFAGNRIAASNQLALIGP